jgi:hypothetical protein
VNRSRAFAAAIFVVVMVATVVVWTFAVPVLFDQHREGRDSPPSKALATVPAQPKPTTDEHAGKQSRSPEEPLNSFTVVGKRIGEDSTKPQPTPAVQKQPKAPAFDVVGNAAKIWHLLHEGKQAEVFRTYNGKVILLTAFWSDLGSLANGKWQMFFPMVTDIRGNESNVEGFYITFKGDLPKLKNGELFTIRARLTTAYGPPVTSVHFVAVD